MRGILIRKSITDSNDLYYYKFITIDYTILYKGGDDEGGPGVRHRDRHHRGPGLCRIT